MLQRICLLCVLGLTLPMAAFALTTEEEAKRLPDERLLSDRLIAPVRQALEIWEQEESQWDSPGDIDAVEIRVLTALRREHTHLNLANLGLHTLPQLGGLLPDLTSLDIQDNPLDGVDGDMLQGLHLQQVTIVSNEPFVQNWLQEEVIKTKLHEFVMAYGHVEAYGKIPFAAAKIYQALLTKQAELDLSDLELEVLPDVFHLLNHLRIVHLQGNGLSKLAPQMIQHLTALQVTWPDDYSLAAPALPNKSECTVPVQTVNAD